ncbi:uL15 family ribosomal protein [Candidatus Woesearchaeota archaeon]|nr:uL15 family ribosomal protein [Candidatus Woesearchaeota archaeon]
MAKFKDKKAKKQRGSKTHGWGSMKKHRGAGHRGGRGNAGSGKRGDAKKPTYQQKFKGKYFGRIGFTSVHASKDLSVNLTYVNCSIEKWVESKKAEKKGDTYVIDLARLGYAKLLGTGSISVKIEVTVPEASAKAIEKVESAGGKVIFPESSASEDVEEKEE